MPGISSGAVQNILPVRRSSKPLKVKIVKVVFSVLRGDYLSKAK
jgi:hypothetical protein